MAVTWTCQVSVQDVAQKLVKVSATRTDDGVTPADVVTVVSQSVDISTPEKKIAALNALWAKYVAKTAKQDAIDAALSGLAAAVVTNFTEREV